MARGFSQSKDRLQPLRENETTAPETVGRPHPKSSLLSEVSSFLFLQRVDLMLKAVSDQHEFGSEKRVNDCAKENKVPTKLTDRLDRCERAFAVIRELFVMNSSTGFGKGGSSPLGESRAALVPIPISPTKAGEESGAIKSLSSFHLAGGCRVGVGRTPNNNGTTHERQSP